MTSFRALGTCLVSTLRGKSTRFEMPKLNTLAGLPPELLLYNYSRFFSPVDVTRLSLLNYRLFAMFHLNNSVLSGPKLSKR